ncbi:PTS sugar transporter subunit IIA, partial [Streptomyces sp. tea 10]|nr:PTS sugar transporter subunit IIA [Streptomyces sp. tea 10]
MSDLINPGLVLLDRDLGESTESVIRALAATVHREGRASTADSLAADALAREAKNATGIPGGIGIPHCRSEAVTQAPLVMARLAPAEHYGAKDGPADIVFFIAAPAGADQEHLKLLSKLARSLMKKPFVASLRAAQSPEEVVDIVDTALGLAPQPDDAAAAPTAATGTAATGSSAATGPAATGADGSAATGTGGAAADAAVAGASGATAASNAGTHAPTGTHAPLTESATSTAPDDAGARGPR